MEPKNYTLIFIVLFLITGIIVPHLVSKNKNFVGNVGHIYFDNSSGQNISKNELNNFFQTINLGAPNFFIKMVEIATQRVEITKTGDLNNQCGTLKAKFYTLFNIKITERYNHIGCP